MCRKFECRKYIHYKTQTGTSCEKCNSKAFRLGIEPATSGLLDQCSTNWATEAVADNLGASSVYLINIYTELAPKLSATASVAQLVEHWSSNPEVAGSIPSRKALELHFSQLVPVWVL